MQNNLIKIIAIVLFVLFIGASAVPSAMSLTAYKIVLNHIMIKMSCMYPLMT